MKKTLWIFTILLRVRKCNPAVEWRKCQRGLTVSPNTAALYVILWTNLYLHCEHVNRSELLSAPAGIYRPTPLLWLNSAAAMETWGVQKIIKTYGDKKKKRKENQACTGVLMVQLDRKQQMVTWWGQLVRRFSLSVCPSACQSCCCSSSCKKKERKKSEGETVQVLPGLHQQEVELQVCDEATAPSSVVGSLHMELHSLSFKAARLSQSQSCWVVMKDFSCLIQDVGMKYAFFN